MVLFNFQVSSKKTAYIWIFPIIYASRQLAHRDLKKLDKLSSHPFFFTLLMFISELSCGFLELVIKCKTSTHQTKQEKEYHKGWLIYLVLFIITVCDLVGYLGIKIISGDQSKLNNILDSAMRPVQLIFLGLIYALMFKSSMYKHHIFGLIIIILGLIALIFPTAYLNVNLKEDFWNVIIKVLLFFFFYCSFSLQNNLAKWLMDYKYMSPWIYLFWTGIFGITLSLIALSISTVVNCKWDFCNKEDKIESFSSLITFFGNFRAIHIFEIIMIYISNILVNAFICMIVFSFTPSHLGVSDSLASFLDWLIITIIDDHKTWLIDIITILIYFIIIIGCLVYTEHLILYFCGLHKNIGTEIALRGKRESDAIEPLDIEVEEFDIQELE